MNNMDNEKSVLEKLFTKQELEELHLSQDEIEAIEDAETICEMTDRLPSNEAALEKILDKIDKTFPSNDLQNIVDVLKVVIEKDPKFFDEIVTLGYLFDQVSEVPPAQTEKVSMDEISAVTKANLEEEQKEKLNAILEAIKNMK